MTSVTADLLPGSLYLSKSCFQTSSDCASSCIEAAGAGLGEFFLDFEDSSEEDRERLEGLGVRAD